MYICIDICVYVCIRICVCIHRCTPIHIYHKPFYKKLREARGESGGGKKERRGITNRRM